MFYPHDEYWCDLYQRLLELTNDPDRSAALVESDEKLLEEVEQRIPNVYRRAA